MGKKYDAVIAVGEYPTPRARRKTLPQHWCGHGVRTRPVFADRRACVEHADFALANKERRDSVLVSLFAPKDDAQTATSPKQQYDDIPY